MQIQFWGAARTVTGSMHLIEVNGQRLLLDCGLFQGRRKEAFEINKNLPFPATSLNGVILSHAHLDHSGNLPMLAKLGFRGKIFATPATVDLLQPMLLDSAHIQENDVKFVNKRRLQQGKRPFEPLYEMEHAEKVLDLLVPINYHEEFQPISGVKARFLDAGHILGSAMVSLSIVNGQGKKSLIFSGDLGRKGLPILKDPEVPDGADFVIMESTYGDRLHQPTEDAGEELRRVIQETYDQGGKVIIPAFAVGRTQEVIYQLEQLWDQGKLPALDVYVDSPLAVDITAVFQKHQECYDDAMVDLMKKHPGSDPFGFKRLRFVKKKEDSQQLNTLKGPAIIISASGMCEAGRVLHHLRHSISDSRNTVLMVGYQAEHTLGRKLLDDWTRVPILGEEHEVKARIIKAESYSAHADQGEILWWLGEISRKLKPSRIFLVHGEDKTLGVLSQKLGEKGYSQVITPERGVTYNML